MDGERLVQNIRAIAIKKGIQMKDLYVMADITSGALSQWKSGKTKPHMSTLSRISAALTVTVQELLDGTETAPHADDGEGRYESMTVGNDDDDSELEELLQIIRSISPDDRPRAKAILAALAQTSAVPSGPSSKVQESP